MTTTGGQGMPVAERESHGCSSRSRTAHNHRQMVNRKLRGLGRPQLIDATGTHRRIRALMAIGWRARDIGPWIGWASGELDPLLRRPTVHRRTADAVAKLYDVLADRPGPSEQTRRRAARAGHLPPLWWDDDTIDDPTYQPTTCELPQPHKHDVDSVNVARALAGQPVDLTRAERLEVVRQLREQRLGYDAIAAHLGVAQRQVHRDLTDLGLIQHQEAATA